MTSQAETVAPRIRPFLVAALVFLVVALCAASLIWRLEQLRLQEEQTRIATLASDHAHALQRNIERALSATYALAALVRQGNGVVPDFEKVAAQMLPLYPGVDSLQLAPDGVTQQIVPRAGNEKGIGRNLLNDPLRSTEALLAWDSGNLTLAGPFDLIQGGVGAVGRFPVFLDAADGARAFWGFASVVIRFPEILDIRLSRLPAHGLAYELWSIHPDTGEKQIIVASSSVPLNAAVEQPLELPNSTWTLSVAPVAGWGNPFGLALMGSLGLLFSLLTAYLTKLLMESKAYEKRLETLVGQRTAEILAREENLRLARFCIDHASIGIFRIEDDSRIVEANDQACRCLGFSREELLSMSIVDIDPGFSAKSWQEHQEVIRTKGSGTIQTRCRRKDGSIFPAEVTINYFEHAGRAFSYSFFQDISAREQTQGALSLKARLLNMIGQAVMATDQDGLITYWNMAAEKLYGWSAAEVLGRNVLDVTPSHVSQAQANEIMRNLVLGQSWSGDFRVRRRDGTTFLAHVNDAPIQDDAGRLIGIVGISFDITEHRRAENELRTLSLAVQQSPASVMITDLSGEIEYVNPKFTQITGYTLDEVQGVNIRALQQGRNEYHLLGKALLAGQEWHGELHSKKKDGTFFWAQTSISPVRDASGTITHYVAINEDITERKRSEEQLEFQATHDALTGLANRNLLHDRLTQSLHYAHRSRRLVAVLLLDIDRFKIINDSLGHEFGDLLLCAVAQRLQQSVREADTVARLGGDEFVVLLAEVAVEEDIGLVARKILDRLTTPYLIAEREITVTASLGISIYPEDSDDGATLIRNADMAMYRAKKERNNFSFYTAEMNRRAFETLELEGALRQALVREEFCLYYQPKVNLASGRIVGCEALVRWRDPRRGVISPADFIPLAEETGLIVPLGTWVLKEACRQARAWQDEGLAALGVAVNLSARQFRKGNLPQIVEKLLGDVGLDPQFLELELTESMVMDDPVEAERTMRTLKGLGVGLSLDDFGTGYSSLNYLRRFPVDNLKIDRSFIRDIVTDPSCASVVTSIIDIAHNLGVKVVAEGVETREQLAFLTCYNCDMLQGYLFSKPLPAEEFADLVREDRRLTK